MERPAAPAPPLGPHTTDAFYDGRVVLRQSRDGYRFTSDALLLVGLTAGLPVSSGAARRSHGPRVLDLGSGCGVLAIALADWWPHATFVAAEAQPSLLEHLRHNIVRNGLEERVVVLPGDVRSSAGAAATTDAPAQLAATPFDVVIMNPPYYPPDSGRLPPNAERAAARHQLRGDIEALIAVAAERLGPDGHLALSYPFAQRERVEAACVRAGLAQVRVRPVVSFADSAPKICFVHAQRGPRVSECVAPLVVYSAPRQYTHETAQFFDRPSHP